MSNCLSKFNKDHFFAIEEFMKNNILFSNERVRLGLRMLAGGRFNSLEGLSKKETFAPLQTGA